jgi:hypothetical protein
LDLQIPILFAANSVSIGGRSADNGHQGRELSDACASRLSTNKSRQIASGRLPIRHERSAVRREGAEACVTLSGRRQCRPPDSLPRRHLLGWRDALCGEGFDMPRPLTDASASIELPLLWRERKRSSWISEILEFCSLPTRLCRGLSTLRRLDTSHIDARPGSFFRAQDFSSQRTSLAAERAALERARWGRARARGVEGSDPLQTAGRSPRPPSVVSPGSDRRRHRRVFNLRAIRRPIVGRHSDPSRRVAAVRPLRGFGLDGCLGAATSLAIA